MIRRVIFLGLLLVGASADGQVPDTLSARERIQRLMDSDSLKGVTRAMDSLQAKARIQHMADTAAISAWAAALKSKIYSRYDSISVTRFTDSLRTSGLPVHRVTAIGDSLKGHADSLLRAVSKSHHMLRERVSSRYRSWVRRAARFPAADSLSRAITDSISLRVPGRPEVQLPASPMRTSTDLAIPGVPSLGPADFEGLELPGEIVALGGETALPNSDQLKAWQSAFQMPEVPEITMPAEAKAMRDDPGKAAETAVMQLDETQSVTRQLAEAEAMTTPPVAPQDIANPEGLAGNAAEAATNHLAGHEKELQGAMAQMSRYKKKYSSLGSLSDIKKSDWLPINGLKGRPFRERFRVGLHAGAKAVGDTVTIDLYPNASYRITGRIETGLSLLYRVRVSTAAATLDQQRPIWGASGFAVVRTFPAVFIRLELEASSWPVTGMPNESHQRDWRWNPYAGLQSSFKLGKRWTGLVQMMYGFDRAIKDAFPERLTARVGVQYKLE